MENIRKKKPELVKHELKLNLQVVGASPLISIGTHPTTLQSCAPENL